MWQSLPVWHGNSRELARRCISLKYVSTSVLKTNDDKRKGRNKAEYKYLDAFRESKVAKLILIVSIAPGQDHVLAKGHIL